MLIDIKDYNFFRTIKGSVLTLPCLAIFISTFFWSCGATKTKLENKTKFVNLQSAVKSNYANEIVGAKIQGYELQDNDRIYFNALRSYLTGNTDTAFVSFNYYRSLDSTNASTYYYLAQIKGSHNYLKETLKDAQKAVDLDPENKWMQAFFAGLLAFSEQYDSAANIFIRIGNKHVPDRDNSFMAASRLFQKAGKPDKAIAVLDTLLSFHNPNDENILMEKQAVYLKAGKFEDAVTITKQLANAYPLSPEYLVQLAEIYELDNQPVWSAEVVQQLAEKFPKNEDVNSYIFGYYLKKRNVDEVAKTLNTYVDAAESNKEKELTILTQIGAYMSGNRGDTSVLTYLSELSEKIVKEKPNNLSAKRLLASLNLYGGKEKEGVEMYNQLIHQYPKNYALWLPLVEHYIYSRKEDTALQYLNKMTTYFPDSTDIQMNKMFIAQNKTKFKDALKYAQIGLDLAQKQKAKDKEMAFFNSIAHLYDELNMYKESDSAYDALLAKDPENIMALNNYAYFLSERGERLEFALNLSKKTLEANFTDPNNLDTYGWILYKMGRYEEAKVYLEKAVAVAGENVSVVVLEHYADVEFRLGNIDNAMKIWKALDKAGEGSKFLKQKIKEKRIYE